MATAEVTVCAKCSATPVYARGWCKSCCQKWYHKQKHEVKAEPKKVKKRKRKKKNKRKVKKDCRYWYLEKSKRKRERAFWKYVQEPGRTADERYKAQLKRFDIQRAEQFRTNDFDESLYKPRFFPMRTLFQPSSRNLYESRIGKDES